VQKNRWADLQTAQRGQVPVGMPVLRSDLCPMPRAARIWIGGHGVVQTGELMFEILLLVGSRSRDGSFGLIQIPLCKIQESQGHFVMRPDCGFHLGVGFEQLFQGDDRLVELVGPAAGIFRIGIC